MTNKTQQASKQLAKAWLSDEGGARLHLNLCLINNKRG